MNKEVQLFYWYNEASKDFMSKGYLPKGMSIVERVAQIANAVGKHYGGDEVSGKVFEYIAKGYYSLSSPVWSNFANGRGLPISCNNVTVTDSIQDILMKNAEVGEQTKLGAGTSGDFSSIRPRGSDISVGGKADGPVHYMSLFENVTDIVSQGSVRRGNFAAYLNVDHPDIMEFLEAREGEHYLQKISMGVVIEDDFMVRAMNMDPRANEILARIIKKRDETGYPYIMFKDTANRNKPAHYKDYTILSSNLCSEIMQPSTLDESFVCCLMSMNLAMFDYWVDTDAVEIALVIMDAVMEEYLGKIENDPLMKTSYKSAKKWRAVGVGTLGYHSMLQQKMIQFVSKEARTLNNYVHSVIEERLLKQTELLAAELGEPEGLKGYNRRNGTLTAIAPTTSSSFILGQVSPSIEPLAGNVMTKDLAKGKYTWFNPVLKEVLAKYGKDTDEVWADINDNYGSVQHLDFLTENEKAVFITFPEVDQFEIIGQAADRQLFLDQSQSLNLTFPHDTHPSVLNNAIFTAWNLGVKSLYYQRPFKSKSQKLAKELTNCVSCEA